MAQEKGTKPQRLYKGLNTDNSYIDQPIDTYRFALNAVNESRDGDSNFLSTEESNKLLVDLSNFGEDYKHFVFIGSIYIGDNTHATFFVTKNGDASFIGLFNKFNGLIIYLNDKHNECLNFNINHPIIGEYRLKNGCDKIIYFTDNYNEVRTINFSKTYVDSKGIILCNDLKLIESINNYPVFVSAEIQTGGSLKSGTYNFAIQYVDENSNETAWLTTSQTIAVYKGVRSGSYDGVMGSSNLPEAIDESNIFGSAPTNKAIKLTLNNLSDKYKYYRIACIEATSGTGTPTRTLVSELIPTTHDTYIHDGNIQRYTEIPTENISVNPLDIGTVGYLEQVDNKLLLANVKNTKRNYCELQKFASKIKSSYVVNQIPAYDYEALGDSKNPNSYFEKVNYMGGEVYAFGIVYIYEDGHESPAYHIPGRPANASDRSPVTSGPDTAHLDGATVEKWRVYNTAIPDDNTGGQMAFWEMQNGEYQNPYNCMDYWGLDSNGQSLTGQKIRHHKFPNRNTVPHMDNLGTVAPEDRPQLIVVSLQKNDRVDCTLEPDEQLAKFLLKIDGNYITEIHGSPATPVIINCSDFDTTGSIELVYEISNNLTGPLELEISDNSNLNEKTKRLSVEGLLIHPSGDNSSPFILGTIDRRVSPPHIPDNKDDVLNLLGIKFDDIELPEGIVGYRIVRAERDNENKTVLGKAYSGALRKNDKYLAYASLTEMTDNGDGQPYDKNDTPPYLMDFNNVSIFSPEVLFRNKDLQPSYIKLENRFEKNDGKGSTDFRTTIIEGINDTKGGWTDNDGYDFAGRFRLDVFKIFNRNVVQESNHKVLDTTQLLPLNKKVNYNIDVTPSENTRILYNLVADNKIMICKIGSEFQQDNHLPSFKTIQYVSLNVDKDVYPVLDNIKYYKVNNNVEVTTSSINFGGDTFLSHFYTVNTMLQHTINKKRYIEFVIDAIALIVAGVVTVLSAGATGPLLTILIIAVATSVAISVTKLAYDEFYNEIDNNPEFLEILRNKSILDDFDDMKDDTKFGALEHTIGMWIESDINIGLREETNNGSIGVLNTHDFESIKSYTTNKFLDFDESTIGDADDDNGWRDGIFVKPEIYKYNEDFSRHDKQKVFFSFPSTYDCCSNCVESFPDRIYYSENSFADEKFDSYGKVLPMNYVSIPGEFGEITNIFTIKGALYAQTKNNLWYIPKNTQERITGDVISLIGTGGFFASEPRNLQDDNIGGAGSTQYLATIKTKYGVLFIDDIGRKIYLLNFSTQAGSNLKDLTDAKSGMSKYFNNHIALELKNQFDKIAGFELPLTNNPYTSLGLGYNSAFDYRYNRFIITKRDYKIIDSWLEDFKTVDNIDTNLIIPNYDINDINKLVYIIELQQFAVETSKDGINNKYVLITDYNASNEIFENYSWTMSYSLNTGAWVSWHSYLPNAKMYDLDDVFNIENSVIWQQNIKDKYLTFNYKQELFIIDYIAMNNGIITKIKDEVTLQTIAEKNDTEQRYITFNKVIFYNSRQCSGKLQLNPIDDNNDVNYMQSTVINTPGVIHARRFDRDWKINDIKDMRVNYTLPIFVNNWIAIKNEFYIDKVLNEQTIDLIKDWKQQEQFRDKYLGVRLFYNTNDDVKLTFNYSYNTEQPTNI